MKIKLCFLLGIILTLFTAVPVQASTQAPETEWSICLGGTGIDFAESIRQTCDGGYIAAGSTDSSDGNFSGSHGDRDAWVAKLNKSGNVIWSKCLGGTGADDLKSIQQTRDGGYIAAGTTNSNNGNFPGRHSSNWVIKLNKSGNIQWRKYLDSTVTNIVQTTDGGYIASGSVVIREDEYFSYKNACVVKLSGSGNIVWSKCLPRIAGNDYVSCIQQTNDGGYIAAYLTEYIDPPQDTWIAKLDTSGNVIWTRNIDGTGDEHSMANSIQQTADNGYIIAGWFSLYSFTDLYDVDSWIVKLDAAGSTAWNKYPGGSSFDYAGSIHPVSQGGYIAAGWTYSNDLDFSGNHGAIDAWIARLDDSGNTIWSRCLGGTGSDEIKAIEPVVDGGYILAGNSSSNDGDVNGNHGGKDAWILKLKPEIITP